MMNIISNEINNILGRNLCIFKKWFDFIFLFLFCYLFWLYFYIFRVLIFGLRFYIRVIFCGFESNLKNFFNRE